MNTKQTIALKYYEQGFNILPTVKGAKQVALSSWQEYQTRKVTKEEIMKWWQNESYGIAVVVGKTSNLVVVDIDSKGDKAKDKELLKGLTPTWIVKTGGGGWHYYYKYPKGKDLISVIRLNGKEIDVKATGIVIAPPSIHPNGNRYEWVMVDGEPEELPEWVLEQTERQAKPKVDWNEKLQENVGEGKRNDSAAQIAGKLINQVADNNLAWTMLQNWNVARCTPPMTDTELRSVWISIQQTDKRREEKTEKEKTNELKNYDGDDRVVPALEVYERLKTQERGIERIGVHTGFGVIDEALRNGYKKADGIMEEDLCIITGHTGQGKSTLVNTLRRNIAKEGWYSLYFPFENTIEAEVRVWDPDNQGTLDYLDFYTPLNFTGSGFQWVRGRVEEALVKHENVKVVFIDHLDDLVDLRRGENEEQGIRRTVKALKNLAKEKHLIIFLVAHPRNMDEQRDVQLSDIKGSSSVKQWASQVLVIKQYPNDESTLKLAKNRHAGTKLEMKMTYDKKQDKLKGGDQIEEQSKSAF